MDVMSLPISLIYKRNIKGPCTVPCGTPDATLAVLDLSPSMVTSIYTYDRKKSLTYPHDRKEGLTYPYDRKEGLTYPHDRYEGLTYTYDKKEGLTAPYGVL